jgi:hypothetical protein
MRQNVVLSGGYMTHRLVNNKNGYYYYQGITTSATGVSWQWEGMFRNSTNGIAGVIRRQLSSKTGYY